MDYAVLIFGLAVFAVACYLDFTSSVEMTEHGIKETNSLVRGKDGYFSPLKGLIFIIGPIALVLIAFFAGKDVAGFDRFWAGAVLVPGAGLHVYAYFSNKKLIAKKKAGQWDTDVHV